MEYTALSVDQMNEHARGLYQEEIQDHKVKGIWGKMFDLAKRHSDTTTQEEALDILREAYLKGRRPDRAQRLEELRSQEMLSGRVQTAVEVSDLVRACEGTRHS